MDSSWSPEQEAAISERRAELAVSAAAGSGKTTVLVERVLRALSGESGEALSLDNVLIVTFTRAAAAELRARIYTELKKRIKQAVGGGRSELSELRRRLAELPRAQISTIDSFCMELLRRYGYREGLPEFRMLRDSEAQLIRHELATRFLDSRLGSRDERLTRLAMAWGGSDGIGAENLAGQRFSSGLRAPLLRLYDFSRTLVDGERWFASYSARLRLDPQNFDFNAPVVQQLERELREWTADALRRDSETLSELQVRCGEAQWGELIRRRRRLLEELTLSGGWDTAARRLEKFKEKQDDIKYKPDLLQAYRRDIDKEADCENYEWIGRRGELLQKEHRKWRDFFSRPWADVALQENEAAELAQALWQLAREFSEEYSAYKRERALMDFSDLERGALSLLARKDAASRPLLDADGAALPSDVALELRQRYRMILVDEHQDTNELQDAIIGLVTADAGENSGRPRFVVGDIKQSIYGFRLATPELFSAACRRLGALTNDQGRLLRLNKNYRSRPAVLSTVNRLFLELMNEDLGGEDYSKSQLEPGTDYGAIFEDQGHAAQEDVCPRLHLVLEESIEAAPAEGQDEAAVADEDDEEGSAALAVYRRVAEVLLALKAEARPIYDKQRGTVRAATWRDMVVLLRSARGRVEPLSAMLEQHGIPVYAPGRSGFYERLEVSDALNLLAVIDNPRQDIALAALLRGPLVGLTPLELLDIAEQQQPETELELSRPGRVKDYWQRLLWFIAVQPESELAGKLRSLLERISAWRDSLRREPLAEVLWRILEETGLVAASAALPGGRQRVANLLALHELSREFSSFEKQGLSRFLRFIRQSRRAAGDFGEAPTLSEAQDAVRIMTVHQSKGLEFPIVVLPDLHREFNQMELNGDLLWHRRAGIGGRWVNLRAGRRAPTLSWRSVREALRRDSVAEELRVLYVALTRARERLELVALGDARMQDSLLEAQPGHRARRSLDWIAAQFAPEITAALSGRPSPKDAALEVLTAPPNLAERSSGHEAPREFSAQEIAELRRRLDFSYPYSAAQRLPAKATVTALAHGEGAFAPPEPEEADSTMSVGLSPATERALLPADPPRPLFMQGLREPRANEIGTATHRLLAEAELSAPLDESKLGELLQRLRQQGSIPEPVAARLDLAALAHAATEVQKRFELDSAELYRELPAALLLPGRALAESEGWSIEGAALQPADTVYVQGSLDLLIVREGSATVLDWKTDRNAPAAVLLERYQRQLEWYCRAASLLLPGRRIEWAIYGLGGAGLVGPFDYRP